MKANVKSLGVAWRRTRVPRLVGELVVLSSAAAGRFLRHQPKEAVDLSHLHILVDISTFLPTTRAGSERSLNAALQMLASRGHEVRVLVPADHESARVGAFTVEAGVSLQNRAEYYRWADVVFTQLDAHNRVARLAALYRRPLVHFLRMGYFNTLYNYGAPDLLVFNAAWVRERHPARVPSIVLHSPVFVEDFRTSRGSKITLINLSDRKGGPVLVPLAEQLPNHQFLAVIGSWGEQLIPEPVPPNVEIVSNTEDIRSVYGQTRVLLHPSSHEPHPRIGLEAFASGIPVIAHPIVGTKEALGEAAIYIDRSDIPGWVEAIKSLDDEAVYEEWSRRAIARIETKNPGIELAEFEVALQKAVATHR